MRRSFAYALSLLFFLLSLTVTHAQTSRITGYVIDTKGNPLSAVSVTVKGMPAGTATDSSGRFEISVAGPQSVLVFSLVSYESKEVPAGRQKKLTVVLNESGSSMNDVVVVGYGTL